MFGFMSLLFYVCDYLFLVVLKVAGFVILDKLRQIQRDNKTLAQPYSSF